MTEEKNKKVTELEATLDAVTKDKNDKLTAAQTALIEANETKGAEIARLEGELSALKEEMQTKQTEAEATLDALTKDKNDKISALQASLTALTEEKNQEIADLKAEYEAVIAEKDAKLAETEAALNAAVEEKNKLSAEKDAELHAITKEKNEKIAEAEAKVQEVKAEIERITAEFEGKIAALGEEKEKIAAELNGFLQNLFQNSEESAEPDYDFLGTWYMEESCTHKICIDIGDLGIEEEFTFLPDNTIEYVTTDADGMVTTTQLFWEIENDVLTFTTEDGEKYSFDSIDREGRMVMAHENSTMAFTRELPIIAKLGEVISQAEKDYFLGSWKLNGSLVGGLYIPVEGFGISSSLYIDEDGVIVELFGKISDKVPYEYSDGTLVFASGDSTVTVEARDNEMIQAVFESEGGDKVDFLFERAE